MSGDLPLPAALLLTKEQAASYCGVSVKTFIAHVKVAPVKIGSLVRYDRRDIDRWAANQNLSSPLDGEGWLEKLGEDGTRARA